MSWWARSNPSKFDSHQATDQPAASWSWPRSEELSASVANLLRARRCERFRPQTLGDSARSSSILTRFGARETVSDAEPGSACWRTTIPRADDQCRFWQFPDRALADGADWPSRRSRVEAFDGAREQGAGRTNYHGGARTDCRKRLPSLTSADWCARRVSEYPIEKLEELVLVSRPAPFESNRTLWRADRFVSRRRTGDLVVAELRNTVRE